MRVKRSVTQILFGHLPNQTIDAEKMVWRVSDWPHARRQKSTQRALRSEIIRLAGPWSVAGVDGGLVAGLLQGAPIELVEVDIESGVLVEQFPELWICRACRRIGTSLAKPCRCGKKSWGAFPFVNYHTCGALRAPRIPRCAIHHDVRMEQPKSSSAAEIRFVCPECNQLLQRGFGFTLCDTCGQGGMRTTVHRAASVYTPRTVVVVNAADTQLLAKLEDAGGIRRVLSWALGGMKGRTFEDAPKTLQSLIDDFIKQGVPTKLAEQFASQMASEGGIVFENTINLDSLRLAAFQRDRAEQEAVSIAAATSLGRTTVQDLASGSAGQPVAEFLYSKTYPDALRSAGIANVDLLDRFPILTGVYGYTRGDVLPGNSTLVPFLPKIEKRGFAVHVDRSETEALLFRLDPKRVLRWLSRRGHDLEYAVDETRARIEILEKSVIPEPGADRSKTPTVGEDLLVLVHTYAHRVLRKASVLAGIDRDSLAELILPTQAAFVLYAAPRGAFVLGGLQAMFESDLHRLLGEVVGAEHRCAMDPGCASVGGGCACCIHVGEPSCRLFNSFLDRRYLHGPDGYFLPLD